MTSRTRNTKLFYKLVNKQRGSLKNNVDDLYVGDSCYSGTEGVLDGFKVQDNNLKQEIEALFKK